MNIFTDSEPAFPYQSSLVSEQLGAPGTPEVHLAITRVAELLLPLGGTSKLDNFARKVAVLRVASGAVLFGWSLRAAEQRARLQLELPNVNESELPQSWITNEQDWLAEAAEQLRSEGVVVHQSYQRQRSNYGWRSLACQKFSATVQS